MRIARALAANDERQDRDYSQCKRHAALRRFLDLSSNSGPRFSRSGRKSLALTIPQVARSIAITVGQDGLEMSRLSLLTCDWEIPTAAAKAESVMLCRERYSASFMASYMHTMHMHVKTNYACQDIQGGA